MNTPSMNDVLAEFGIPVTWALRHPARMEAQADVPDITDVSKAIAPASVVSECDTLADLEAAINACTLCALASGRETVRLSPSAAEPIFWLDSHAMQDPNERKLFAAILQHSPGSAMANAVRCPTPGGRLATNEERSACHPYLLNELKLRAPRAVFALGRHAAQAALNEPEPRTMGQWRTQDWPVAGARMTVVAHPAQMLSDGEEKRKLWEQLVKSL